MRPGPVGSDQLLSKKNRDGDKRLRESGRRVIPSFEHN